MVLTLAARLSISNAICVQVDPWTRACASVSLSELRRAPHSVDHLAYGNPGDAPIDREYLAVTGPDSKSV